MEAAINYYQHHIGDFNNATRHLERLERAIYREMLDLYYDTEAPLTLDFKMLCHKLCARREGEPEIVQAILNEFFTKTDEGWTHHRCDLEIDAYREKVKSNRVNGKKGGRPKKTQSEPNENPTETQSVSFGNPTITQVKPNETLS